MDLAKSGPDQAVNTAAVNKAITSLTEQRESIEGKLTSLEKYTNRLEAVADWLSSAREKLTGSSGGEAVSNVLVEVNDRETDVKEVLGNFTNLEKECQVATQIVSPQLQVLPAGKINSFH